MHHDEAIEYFQSREGERRQQGERRMSVERRIDDARDACKIKAFDEIVALFGHDADDYTLNDIRKILEANGAVLP